MAWLLEFAAISPHQRLHSGGGDTLNPQKHASGLDVVDLSLSKQIRHNLDFNFAIDNLNNKAYWETQNSLVSRLENEPRDGIGRVHATPGYPI